MTIRRGRDWGVPGALAAGARIHRSDREASEALQSAHDSTGVLPTEIGLLGGDLHRTLGSPDHSEEDLRSGRAMRFPVDVGVVRADGGGELILLSYLIGRPSRRSKIFDGELLVIMNGSFVGQMDLGPRAHPNDGRLDVTSGAVPRGDRRAARKRVLSGSHVPHPALEERRTAADAFDLGRDGLEIEIDGRPIGRVARLEVSCRPDALVVVV